MSTGPERVWAIVLAAGAGARFGVAKQFEDLGGIRLVDRSVTNASACCDGCVIVLPHGVAWDGPTVDHAVTGGAVRADSVRAGLAAVPIDAGIVVIHDAAHPLASAELFETIIGRVLAGYDAAVPVLPLRETVMRVDGADGLVIGTVAREGLNVVQMPHAFRADVLRAAHERGIDAPDDASLVYAAGGTIATVAGDPFNVHITTPDELAFARRLL